jgi:hypothetical protein
MSEEQIPGHLLINDVIMSPERLAQFNREAEEVQKIAAETGLLQPGQAGAWPHCVDALAATRRLNDCGGSYGSGWPGKRARIGPQRCFQH